MRIPGQTSTPTHGRPPVPALCGVLLAVFASAGATPASAQKGEIRCVITENGTPSAGSFAVEHGGKRVASGACGRAVSVPVGSSRVTVRLDGALDNPAQTVKVDVVAGQTVPVAVDFETGTLEVRIATKGKRGTGLVAVEKGGKRIGTIGSGVAVRLSAGAYVVVVRLDGQEQRHEVDLRPGQSRLVRAQF